MARRPGSFSTEEIAMAAHLAGIEPEDEDRLLAALIEVQIKRKKGGRPAIDDSRDLELMRVMVQAGVSCREAASTVTAKLPESQRFTVRERLIRKEREGRGASKADDKT